MRYLALLTALVLCAPGGVLSGPVSADPNSFHTNANFSVDNNAMSLSTAVATIEPRLGAPGYSWLRIYFYSFPVATDDMPAVMKGDTSSMDRKWNKKRATRMTIILREPSSSFPVDKDSKVWQVDMSIRAMHAPSRPLSRM